jgi:spermidine synthase
MSLYLDERDDGSCALYLDGDLQFDSRDEALYHESLALPALCLARRARPTGLRVLICGGGDGLALRECLRFPGVVHADLVDYDPEVVELGRTRFAALNADAFEDSRAHVHIADAWDFLKSADPYDVVLCDFTVPRRAEDTRVFAKEWYARLAEVLTPDGLLALNAVSPQRVPEAFWCLRKTVRAAGLSALPYRACIPSFRAHGYGAWGFLLASHSPLNVSLLHDLGEDCPVPTRQTDLSRLWRGARFSRAERRLEQQVPVHTLQNGCLLPLLLNPGLAPSEQEAAQHPYDLNPLLRAIPILHPYHTRLMVETLAKQVIGTMSALDLRRLVDAVLRRAAALPQEVRTELTRLREFLSLSPMQLQVFGAWCGRLFVALVLLMTLANAIAPDNAFAKGSGEGGGGHGSSASVGHSSFGGGRGFSTGGGRASGGSFSGTRGFSSSSRAGGSFGRGGSFSGSRSFGHGSVFSGHGDTPHFTGSGFRSSYGSGHAVDLAGVPRSSRSFFYCGSGGGHFHSYTVVHGGTAPAMAPQTHQSLFVAAKDMLVLDNGDVIITLSDTAYLLVTNGTVALMSDKNPDPLLLLYPDPTLFQNIRQQLEDQGLGVEQAITARQDWLSWVGWTSALLPAIGEDRKELTNLQDLDHRLHTAFDRLGNPPASAVATPPPAADEVELFIGCRLLANGDIAIRDDRGEWLTTDGATLTTGQTHSAPRPSPPLLTAALYSILVKLDPDTTAALASDRHDLQLSETELQALQQDLNDYQLLQRQNDSSYEVDYGTEQIPASDAISRTQNDIDQNMQETKRLQDDITRLTLLQERIQALQPRYKTGR